MYREISCWRSCSALSSLLQETEYANDVGIRGTSRRDPPVQESGEQETRVSMLLPSRTELRKTLCLTRKRLKGHRSRGIVWHGMVGRYGLEEIKS